MIVRSFVVAVATAGAACAHPNADTAPPRVATVASVSTPPGPSPEQTPLTPPITRGGMHAVSLRGVAPAFATYLVAMHRRIHPEFTDKELVRLATLPAGDPVNDKQLVTRVELVVAPADGALVGATIGKTSGVDAFDAAALDSLRRAAPFGPAPSAIVSADGQVHVDWEFAREETFACGTMHVRPFLFAR